ncbi:uncharacterized protein LOC142628904 [Castanea sativa]|uniref:uncharacterized protein LOC142628904 n=1 Tax=Castanea sativa TaxID=21020 RepID=UPI003F64ECDB
MVSSLIDPTTKWWKVNIIRATFLPFEANTIVKIPLSHDLPKDKIIWIGNSHEVFTVKSAYHLAYALLKSNWSEECSTGDPCKPIWRKLWHLNLLAKIKIFARRACVNGLPTMEVITCRGFLKLRPARNSIAHGGCGLPPNQVWQMAKSSADDFVCSASWDLSQPRALPTSWVPPPTGVHKINVDGASPNVESFSSVGVVIRDCMGQVVAALCKPLQACFPAELTEIMALEQGILLAMELQLPRGILQASNSFESCLYKHVSRKSNTVAHELAQHARRTGTQHLWKGVMPPFVASFIHSDVL